MCFFNYIGTNAICQSDKDHPKGKNDTRGGKTVKQDEKKPLNWEIKDPKPPVVQSGRMENHRR